MSTETGYSKLTVAYYSGKVYINHNKITTKTLSFLEQEIPVKSRIFSVMIKDVLLQFYTVKFKMHIFGF